MVRPRVGDFIYSLEELGVMKEDIAAFADVGITGVALGALNKDGGIDLIAMQLLTEIAASRHLKGSYPVV